MESLEDYSKRMEQEFNETSWLIGWESLPKYIGHKIFNTNTKEIVTVMWDNGYPESLSSDGARDYFKCCDFRHQHGYWLYKVEEEY